MHDALNTRQMLMDFLHKEELPEFSSRDSWSSGRSDEAKMRTTDDHCSSFDVNSSALGLDQAKGIQPNSMAQFPSFLKQLLKSHLSGKFYLGLPKKFCDAHLPSQNVSVVLVDENEKEYSMMYSVRKNRLAGGWRRFSIAHKLLEGDALAFYLVDSCRFRVYTVRSSKFTEDDAIGLQNCDFQNSKPASIFKADDQMEANPCVGKLKSNQEKKRARLVSDTKLEAGHSGNAIDHFGPNLLGDGQILDSQIPRNLRTKYYSLCCSQKMFLHDPLIKGISSRLAVVMISETTDIADKIRSADIATPLCHLECWERTLKAFEDLGMGVRFLRDRLHRLSSVSRESQATLESKRTIIAEADEEICNLEATPSKLKAFVGSLKAEIEALNLKIEKLNFEFQELAEAPW